MKVLLSGNEAIALGAWEAGVQYASAYPGTPSTEILENLARYPGVRAEWGSNEKVALDNAVGASFGGARALAAMKHVGVNVAADSLMSVSYIGVTTTQARFRHKTSRTIVSMPASGSSRASIPQIARMPGSL